MEEKKKAMKTANLFFFSPKKHRCALLLPKNSVLITPGESKVNHARELPLSFLSVYTGGGALLFVLFASAA